MSNGVDETSSSSVSQPSVVKNGEDVKVEDCGKAETNGNSDKVINLSCP